MRTSPFQKSFHTLFANEFLDIISDAFFVFDYSLHFIFANKKAVQLVGKTKKELLGKKVSEVFPELKKKSIYLEFLRTRKVSKKPIKYYSPSLEKWLAVTIHPTKYGIAVCVKDITKEKKADDLAKESQDIMKAFFQHSPVGLAIYDDEMRFLNIDNGSAKRYYGKRVKDILGKSLKVLAPEYAGKLTEVFQEVLDKNKPIISELSGKDKENNTVFALSSHFPLRFANGSKGIGTVAIDITERHQNEMRKDEFIAMASHELKTPLTSAKIFTQVLQRRFSFLKDEESSSLLQKVNTKIDLLEALIKELLDAAITNRKNLSAKREKFIFRQLVQQTIAELQLSITHKIVVDWQTNEYLYADKDRISQILINFITNAAKFSPNNTDIIIRSRKKKNVIVISIQDFGIGIPKEEQMYIFDRFYQTNSNDNTYPGLGLGLYITKKIVEENGGQVWVESKKGNGSTFYFSLPIYKEG